MRWTVIRPRPVSKLAEQLDRPVLLRKTKKWSIRSRGPSGLSMPRTLAIGDIHGHFEALRLLDELVPFRDDDVLVFLGDYVDRGPHSKAVLDWLIERHALGNMVALLGNHDQMMLEARTDIAMRDSWLRFGGRETLLSYRNEAAENGESRDTEYARGQAHIPDSHYRFLSSNCQLYHEADSHIFVHACVEPDLPLAAHDSDVLLWRKMRNPQPHVSGKTVICGHTAQSSGWPLDAIHTVCIDTWVYGSGWLTCLDVDSGRFWQAKSTGETRATSLKDLRPQM